MGSIGSDCIIRNFRNGRLSADAGGVRGEDHYSGRNENMKTHDYNDLEDLKRRKSSMLG
jgi:hypothetical protein